MRASSPSSKRKTIFLIRHAESEENRRLYALRDAATDLLYHLKIPKSSDVSAASELINVAAQIDSPVSEFGMVQIAHMAQVLQDHKSSSSSNSNNNNVLSRIELVAHSPLQRARDTCVGMLGCLAPSTLANGIQRVEQLDLLREKTPSEWINSAGFRRRLSQMEDWLAQQSENCIALVGHSQFFKKLLQVDYLIGNCDVIQATFDPELETRWLDIQNVHVCRIVKPDPSSDVQVERTRSVNELP